MTTAAVDCQNLTLRVGYRPLLRSVTFLLPKKQAVALTGPNGIGKTTLLRTLAGIARPHAGTVEICGHQIWPQRDGKAEPVAVYLASQPALLLDLSVQQNLEYMCASFGVKPEQQQLLKSLERVDLTKRENQVVRTLSTGQKRRLTLAALLLLSPSVVFADEPTNGLDESGIKLCLEIFSELMTMHDCSVLAATHDTRLVQFCEREINVTEFVPQKTQKFAGSSKA